MIGTGTLPQVIVETDGQALSPEQARALGEVRVQQRLSLPTLCELTFHDPPGPLGAAAALTPGTPLRVRAAGHDEPLFDGEVTVIEHLHGPAHERAVRIRGYDLLHRLRKRYAVRAHVQVTAADLARELLADTGLTVQSSVSVPVWQQVIQHRQSDLELLTEVAERCGLFLTVHNGVLHLLTLEGEGETLPLQLGDSLLEATLEVSAEPACRTVHAAGWNPLRVEAYEGRATGARVGREVEAQAPPESVGGNGTRELPGETVQDAQHAEAVAQAELDRRVGHEVTFWGMAEGDPRLRPGARVEIRGVAGPLAGRYVITAATHTIDDHKGYVSELSSAPPRPRERPYDPLVAALGVVTRVDDPDGLGRIRLSLPAYADVESEWLHVLSPAAGQDKGLAALPDVGDSVLVLFPGEAMGPGVVLGGLYGMRGPPDSGVEGNSVRRYTLRLPGGQVIRLDDGKKTIRLENSDGSYVELAPGKVLLHAATDMDLEAPGRKLRIRAAQVDFERA